MSADNGIYITKWNDGYRVAECAAIDNLDYIDTKEGVDYILANFGNSEVFEDLDSAKEEAYELENKTDVLEYGIVTLELNYGNFPGAHKTPIKREAQPRHNFGQVGRNLKISTIKSAVGIVQKMQRDNDAEWWQTQDAYLKLFTKWHGFNADLFRDDCKPVVGDCMADPGGWR